MKISNPIFVFLGLACLACSNEAIEISENSTDPLLTNYLYTNYNISETPNTETSTTNYVIENNKIISANSVSYIDNVERHYNYYYTSERIDSILTYTNNILSRIQRYTYNSNGNLMSYMSHNHNDQSSNLERHIFTHSNDTIYSVWSQSDDGINFDNILLNSKIVLDANNNRTYFESHSPANNQTKAWIGDFDANQNLQSESYYSFSDDGTPVQMFENSYTFANQENIFNRINMATFTRKNMMLLYHLQSDAINAINAKSICENTITSMNSTWGNSFAEFEIINSLNDNDITIESDFKTFVEGNIFTRFSQKYIFQ